MKTKLAGIGLGLAVTLVSAQAPRPPAAQPDAAGKPMVAAARPASAPMAVLPVKSEPRQSKAPGIQPRNTSVLAPLGLCDGS